MNLNRFKYRKSSTIAVVLEGVKDGDAVSLVASYRSGIGRCREIWGDPVRTLDDPPSNISHRADQIDHTITPSACTATLVATDEVMEAVVQAHQRDQYAPDAETWLGGVQGNATSDQPPGRHRYTVDNVGTPSHSRWHTSTTQYALLSASGPSYEYQASTPIPTDLDEDIPHMIYGGDLPLLGRRMLVCEVLPDGEIETRWFGFISEFDTSAQQNALEISAVGPLTVFQKSGAEKRSASVDVSYDQWRWRGTYETTTDRQGLPQDPTPAEMAIAVDDGVLPLRRTEWSDLPTSDTYSESISLLSFGSDTDTDLEGGGEVVYGYDDTGDLGSTMIRGHVGDNVTSLTPLIEYLDYFYVRPRLLDGTDPDAQVDVQAYTYDGSIWADALDLDGMREVQAVAPPIDHFLISSDTSVMDIAQKALFPHRYMLRMTDTGQIGLKRVSHVTPDDIATLFPPEDSDETAQRGTLLSDRIDLDWPIRKTEASYSGEIGSVIDRIDPTTITVQPDQGVRAADVTPSYISASKTFDYGYFSRADGHERALGSLVDYRALYRGAPLLSCVIQLESWTPWDSDREGLTAHSRCPDLGDMIRLDGGPESGMIGPDGKRIDFTESDVIPIGIITAKTVRWQDRTAELDVLLIHWDSGDIMPKYISPSAEVIERTDAITLSIYVNENRELLSADGDLGFMIGDQIVFCDGTGQTINNEIHTIDYVNIDTLRVEADITGEEAEMIDAYAGNTRGITIRLASVEDFENSWDTSGYLSGDNAARRYSYWGASDYWVMT